MPRYALLIAPSTNRVYAEAALPLTRAELSIFGGVSDIAEARIGGVPYVTFEASGDVAHLANLSSAYALFERVEDLLRPVLLAPLARYDSDLITIPKYAGKTNEQFTKLVLNLTVLASSGDGGSSNPYKSPVKNPATIPYPSVGWPASDPLVTTVGGTYLCTNPITGIGVDSADPPPACQTHACFREVGWIDSGGGYSILFPRPSYQVRPPCLDSYCALIPSRTHRSSSTTWRKTASEEHACFTTRATEITRAAPVEAMRQSERRCIHLYFRPTGSPSRAAT